MYTMNGGVDDWERQKDYCRMASVVAEFIERIVEDALREY